MSILALARFQFAMTTIFHFFFVPLTIGLALMVAIMESLYVKTNDEQYNRMSIFWGQLFLLSFAVGVVTGIIQEFQFGMNWSDYSRFVGDIFGAPLAIEALLAFFMESVFIGLWMFSRGRVSKMLHAVFIWLVAIGSMLSALWILTANAFMQKPVGFAIINGRAQLVNFFALLANNQTWLEYFHVILGAFTVGAFFVAGTSAWQLIRKKDTLFFKRSLTLGLIVGLISSIGTVFVGDLQMKDLIHQQPMKFAAMEALYENSQPHAPWTVIASIDTEKKVSTPLIKVPYLLGILSGTAQSIPGMNQLNREFEEKYGRLSSKYGEDPSYYVPVKTLFWSFRVMAGFSSALIVMALLSLIFVKKLEKQKFLLFLLTLCTIAPFVCTTTGWLIAELGRYPWTVYGIMTIADSISPTVTAPQLITTIVGYFCIFTMLAAVMLFLMKKEFDKGPAYQHNTEDLSVDPFEGGGY